MGHHFISYSRVDAKNFAGRLADELPAAWLDTRKLRPGLDWDEQIDESIKTCECLLFVMTTDSVTPNSVCKNEWTRALKYRKPVIPLRLDQDAELPFRLEPRGWIDFTGDFETALAELRNHLQWLSEPAGVLQALKDRWADAKRDLSRAAEWDQPRIRDEIAELERQIARQQLLVTSPEQPRGDVEGGSVPAGDRLLPPAQPAGINFGQPPVLQPDTTFVQSQGRPDGVPVNRPAWPPGVLERAGKDLAFYIGPMARLIVSRAAERAQSRKELYKALAAEIVSPSDRQKFLAFHSDSDDDR
ncbi:MAG TPA: toll/interleukin-1 receptor domain-containing protein [Terriglobia bacterium]|nr:toll/interleukin-1 receptor domain-containing protein [Terriglobia bacterium]